MTRQSKNSDFDFKNSNAYYQINHVYFFETIRVRELVAIADLLVKQCHNDLHVRINRDIKRKEEKLYKWFEDNWDVVQPHLPHLILLNKNGVILNKYKYQSVESTETSDSSPSDDDSFDNQNFFNNQ